MLLFELLALKKNLLQFFKLKKRKKKFSSSILAHWHENFILLRTLTTNTNTARQSIMPSCAKNWLKYLQNEKISLVLCSSALDHWKETKWSQLNTYTDRNIMEDSYQLVTHFPVFPLWEYRIASFNLKFLIKGSNCVLPEREIREMFC